MRPIEKVIYGTQKNINPTKAVTVASLLTDMTLAGSNIMRRVIQGTGCRLFTLVMINPEEVVNCAIQEDANAIAPRLIKAVTMNILTHL